MTQPRSKNRYKRPGSPQPRPQQQQDERKNQQFTKSIAQVDEDKYRAGLREFETENLYKSVLENRIKSYEQKPENLRTLQDRNNYEDSIRQLNYLNRKQAEAGITTGPRIETLQGEPFDKRLGEITRNAKDFIDKRKDSVKSIGPLIDQTQKMLKNIADEHRTTSLKINSDLKKLYENIDKVKQQNNETIESYNKCVGSWSTIIDEVKRVEIQSKQDVEKANAQINLALFPLSSITGRTCIEPPVPDGNGGYLCKVIPYKGLLGTRDTDKVDPIKAKERLETIKERQTLGANAFSITLNTKDLYVGKNAYLVRDKQPSVQSVVIRGIAAELGGVPTYTFRTGIKFIIVYNPQKIIGRITRSEIRQVIDDQAGFALYDFLVNNNIDAVDYIFYDGELVNYISSALEVSPAERARIERETQRKELERQKAEIDRLRTEINTSRVENPTIFGGRGQQQFGKGQQFGRGQQIAFGRGQQLGGKGIRSEEPLLPGEMATPIPETPRE